MADMFVSFSLCFFPESQNSITPYKHLAPMPEISMACYSKGQTLEKRASVAVRVLAVVALIAPLSYAEVNAPPFNSH
eukprot:1474699-Pyramimonas_sp.AAC.1